MFLNISCLFLRIESKSLLCGGWQQRLQSLEMSLWRRRIRDGLWELWELWELWQLCHMAVTLSHATTFNASNAPRKPETTSAATKQFDSTFVSLVFYKSWSLNVTHVLHARGLHKTHKVLLSSLVAFQVSTGDVFGALVGQQLPG